MAGRVGAVSCHGWRTGRAKVRCRAIAVVLAALIGIPLRAAIAADDESRNGAISDTGRFYLYFQAGNAFLLDDHFTDDVEVDTPGTRNVIMGGGGGYNLTDHWGIEFQAHGTEPDLRSKTRGKVKELSNITLIGAVRYRHPMRDGRFVPYATAGLGGSLNDVNDTADKKLKITMDERTIVASVSTGFDYFLTPNVAVGLVAHYYIYPEADTKVVAKSAPFGREESSVDLSSVALMGHIRLFPGEMREPGVRRGRNRLLLARHGPFDTGDRRVYLYALGGPMLVFDDAFALDAKVQAPGGSNWLLGGGMGFNIDGHWSVETQLAHTEPTIDGNPPPNQGFGGKLAELSNLTVLPGIRYRHPFRNGRVVPFISGHFGGAFNLIGDTRYDEVEVRVQESSVASAVVVGVEYFLNHHLSFGLSVPFYIYPDWVSYVERRRSEFGRIVATERTTSNFSGVALLLQLKAFIP